MAANAVALRSSRRCLPNGGNGGAVITFETLFPPLAAILGGYLLGSIPFGLLLTRAAGLGDVRDDRLGQYRRDQRAAHRPKGPGRGDLAARCRQGRGGGAARLGDLAGLALAPLPASPPFSATSIPSGCASRAARGSPPCRHRRRLALADDARRGRGLAAGRARHAAIPRSAASSRRSRAPVDRGGCSAASTWRCCSSASPCWCSGGTARISAACWRGPSPRSAAERIGVSPAGHRSPGCG